MFQKDKLPQDRLLSSPDDADIKLFRNIDPFRQMTALRPMEQQS
jgi:hypothetical protein